jgi:crossover junction endodeoxyribonuclease RuvC
MIAAELGIEIDQIPLDSTDALALAMCHAGRVLRSGGVPGREL